MNKVILSGNLVKDIELQKTEAGNDVVKNTIAVKRDFKNPKGEYETDFINFVAWGNQALFLHKFASKGDRLEIVGRWQVRNYQDNQGNNRQVNEVVVENISVFQKPKKEEEQQVNSEDEDLPFGNDDDLPF